MNNMIHFMYCTVYTIEFDVLTHKRRSYDRHHDHALCGSGELMIVDGLLFLHDGREYAGLAGVEDLAVHVPGVPGVDLLPKCRSLNILEDFQVKVLTPGFRRRY